MKKIFLVLFCITLCTAACNNRKKADSEPQKTENSELQNECCKKDSVKACCTADSIKACCAKDSTKTCCTKDSVTAVQ